MYKTFFSRRRGQAILEFALILPLLLLVVIGLLEVGRAIFMFASVTNASREAARFASAYGVNTSDELNIQNCAGIRATAKRTGFLLRLEDGDIDIDYDEGPGTAAFDSCDDTTDGNPDGVDTNVNLTCGDRVVVTVRVTYAPVVNILPITERDIVSQSARTYYGVISLNADTALKCDNDPNNDP